MKTKIICFLLATIMWSYMTAQICDGCPSRKRGKYRWHLKQKDDIKSNSSIRFDGIYFKSWTHSNGTIRYSYAIFFDNGRCFKSCAYCSMPDSAQVCDFNSLGYWGAYSLEGNEIICEFFSPYTRYFYHYGIIDGEKLDFTHYKYQGWLNLKKKDEALPEYIFVPMKLDCRCNW